VRGLTVRRVLDRWRYSARRLHRVMDRAAQVGRACVLYGVQQGPGGRGLSARLGSTRRTTRTAALGPRCKTLPTSSRSTTSTGSTGARSRCSTRTRHLLVSSTGGWAGTGGRATPDVCRRGTRLVHFRAATAPTVMRSRASRDVGEVEQNRRSGLRRFRRPHRRADCGALPVVEGWGLLGLFAPAAAGRIETWTIDVSSSLPIYRGHSIV
jgi:hypothetical protein